MQVVVDSLLTNYEVHGDPAKPAILILHGWGDNAKGWRSFAGELADKYAVYAVDLPGFGGTDRPPQAWRLDDYADFTAHFLAKIDVQPYAVIGHSNGGAIAVRGLAGGRLQAQRLVLLASAGVRSEYKGRKKVIRLIAKAGKAIVMPLPGSVKQRLRSKLYTTVGSDMLVAEEMQGTFKKIVSDDIQEDAAKLMVPTLLMYGEDDESTPPNFGRLLHERIDGSTLEILAGSGHFIHQDQSAKTLAAVKEFLA
jgi:pimeloyl-ACP methyl ester carboxylesterase